MGYGVDSLHKVSNQNDAIMKAEAIVVGGGNTFKLLHVLYKNQLLDTLRARVEAGVPYISWSAGSNIACPTIKTTNDMPIVEVPSLNALGLVPFQINPHYEDPASAEESVETREERINEFIEINPRVYVVGLREGSLLRIEDFNVKLSGDTGARIFIKGKKPTNYSAKESVQFLLD
jgi:dipeptidase E